MRLKIFIRDKDDDETAESNEDGEDRENDRSTEVLILPAWKSHYGERLSGLLLEQTGTDKGEYRRLALFRIEDDDGSSCLKFEAILAK